MREDSREPWEMTLSEFRAAWLSGRYDLPQQARWEAGVGIPFGLMGGRRAKARRAATARAHVAPAAPVQNIIHRDLVARAIALGSLVPARVLAQYPDLAAEEAAQT